MQLSDHDREILAGHPRHVQATMLARGECGPLVALPFTADRVAAAYLVYLAWIRARVPGNMLSGRPGFEAWDTMRSRVLIASRRSGSFREFGADLFRRLNLSISSISNTDAVWWFENERAHASRWPGLSSETTMTEIVTLAKLLDDLLRDAKQVTPTTTATQETADVAE